MRNRTRLRGLVLLIALVGAQLVTLGAAFGDDPSCLCDENMCTHHPKGHGEKGHGSHDHGSSDPALPGHASHGHDAHGAATHGAATPTAHKAAAPAAPSADHCAYQPALVDTGDCSMRGCNHQGEDSLPVTALASLPDPTSIARPEGVTALSSAAIGSTLDRSSLIEPPPPRHLPV